MVVQGDCTSTFSYIEKSRFNFEVLGREEADAQRAVGVDEVGFCSVPS